MRTLVASLFVCLAAAVTGCGSTTPNASVDAGGYAFAPLLQNQVEHVIVPTYADLAAGAQALKASVDELAAAPTDAKLAAARTRWKEARVHWEQSEAFLFGPVATLGLDPALDSWPVDRVQLDQVLASSLALTAESVSQNLGGGLKGFHTIEYLLWGEGQSRTAASLKPRELEYLKASTDALRIDAETLHDAWASEEGGFAKKFMLSGGQGGAYFSARDGAQELVNGIVGICDEVANGKIADPFDQQSQALVESQFSYNSLADFADNLRSAQNLYLGHRGTAVGPGLADLVAAADPELDQRIRTELTAAIDAIVAISPTNDPPFRVAILDAAKAPAIRAAQEAIRKVMQTFERDVTPLLSR